MTSVSQKMLSEKIFVSRSRDQFRCVKTMSSGKRIPAFGSDSHRTPDEVQPMVQPFEIPAVEPPVLGACGVEGGNELKNENVCNFAFFFLQATL